MTLFLIILASALMLAAVILAFAGRAVGAVAAWLSLAAAYYASSAGISYPTLAFWGLAALMVIGIAFLNRWSRPPLAANAYITGGALAGAVVGMFMSVAGIVLGAVVGALFGGIAYSRTPSGSYMRFPAASFWGCMAQAGLPAIVVMGIVGHAVAILIASATPVAPY